MKANWRSVGVQLFVACLIWPLFLGGGVRGQADEDDGGGSLASSFLSGLLDTITTTAESKECPGVCVHALATLICTQVLDHVACPSPSMRCCIEGPPPSNGKNTSMTSTAAPPKPTSSTAAPSPSRKPPMESSGKPESGPANKEDVRGVCPGVCVAERIADYCEATLGPPALPAGSNTQQSGPPPLCKAGLRCCISKEGPSASGDKTVTTADSDSIIPPSRKPPGSLASSVSSPSNPSTIRPPPPAASPPSPSLRTPCRGECVSGLFALFCDEVDSDADCPGDGSCCVTNPPPPPPPPSKPIPAPPSEEKTVPTTTETPSSTTTAAPTTTTEKSLPRCPGFCLLNIMAAFCERPSILIRKTSNCGQGSVCCDNTRQASKKPVQSSSGGGGGGGGGALSAAVDVLGPLGALFTTRPPPPKTTSTTPAPKDDRPECPGSCIVPYLSFTCFRNAEMTDVFKCRKSGTQCCAPKSQIRERLGETSGSQQPPTMPPPHPSYSGPSTSFNDSYHGPYPPHHGAGYGPGSYHRPPSQAGVHHSVMTSGQSGHPPHLPPGVPSTSHRIPPTQATSQQTPLRSPVAHSKYICGVKGGVNSLRRSRELDHPIANANDTSHANIMEQENSVTPPSLAGNTIPEGAVESAKPQLPDMMTQAESVTGVSPSLVGAEALAFLNESRAHRSWRKGRVVGGEDADPGEWCWQAALINSLNQYLCGGALIGTQWVLTAAHCVTNIVRSGDAIYVRVGDHDLTRKYGSPGAQTLRVATTYIHHNHNSQTLDNDVALLKLHGQAELRGGEVGRGSGNQEAAGGGVCLVCLPARGVSQAAGKRCTVTGYGYMGEAGPIPLRVREAVIPIVNDAECIRKINAVTEKIFILPASSFCAGGEEGNDACQALQGGHW
ncbi:protein masquerade isoform X2 [Ischnura elegans]|uniref:protein masquerade isoform X2 n=1 Tax=Ischnura elegans TaxID=197161 RepID=UPI001ED86960|nr:protein masquerade isoform X2 [Ischnura elegans]